MTRIDMSPDHARRALTGVAASDEIERDDVIDRYAAVVWNHVTEPGDGTAGRIIATAGWAGALRSVFIEGQRDFPGVSGEETSRGVERWGPRLSTDAVDAALRTAASSGIRLITPQDAAWPVQLADLDAHAPLCLWVRGNPAILRRLEPSIALVGARAATAYGEHVAMELAAELSASGIPVISGAAYGIDGAAHRAALSARGHTVALLAGGVERAYPAGHTDLIGRVAAAGAVVSEAPCGSAPTKWRFLARNRVIAALASATVVVEAGWRSGSLNTAGHAAALGRPLGAVPGPITSAASAGTHRLLREYGAHCITSAAEARELLGFAPAVPVEREDPQPATDATTRVRDALSTRSWRDAGDVARRSGLAHREVEAALGLLQLEGRAERGATGWRLRSKIALF